MTCAIQKHIMAIILAGALMLFMGLAVQTVNAEDYEYTVDCSSVNNVGIALPGLEYTVKTEIRHNDQVIELPEGAKCEWSVGFMDPAMDGLNPDDYAQITPIGDTTEAIVQFFGLPDGVNEVDAFIGVKLLKQDSEGKWQPISGISTAQMWVQNDYYEVNMPDIDPEMLVQEPVEVSVEVLHHELDPTASSGEKVTPADAVCTWDYDSSIVEVEPIKTEKGFYTFRLTRLRADTDYDDMNLSVYYGDPNFIPQQYFPLYKYSFDLSKGSVEIVKGKYYNVYEENWCFVDEVAAKKAGAAASIPASNVYVNALKGTIEQKFNDKLFNVEVEKYTGYDPDTYNDKYKKGASFPLTFDKSGSKDSNGNRTDGTALYRFKLSGKDGSGWTGKTDWMYVWVCSKYSLYTLQNNYGGGYVSLPKLEKYITKWTYDPYWRYEVPKSSTLSKKLTVKLGPSTLKMGTDYDAVYVNENDSSKKFTNKFPTTAGIYRLEVKGKSPYYGTDKSIHVKLAMKNPMTVKAKTLKVKAKLKKKKLKKAKTYKVTKVLKVKNAKGKVTYTKLSGNKKITVASNGKVTLKKGLKKGTYKVKVKVQARGNAQYFSAAKTVTFKVKVKKK